MAIQPLTTETISQKIVTEISPLTARNKYAHSVIKIKEEDEREQKKHKRGKRAEKISS